MAGVLQQQGDECGVSEAGVGVGQDMRSEGKGTPSLESLTPIM